MKIRVFKTPSKKDNTEVHIGIPQGVQLDDSISSLQIAQIENLPPPQSLDQLSITPMVIQNKPVNAFKNVQKSTLQPGYSLQVVPKGDFSIAQPPIQIEEVQIPAGYVHLDDITESIKYNYNRSYFLSDEDFKPLPEEKNLPTRSEYNLIFKETNILARHTSPIDHIKVYYRRISEYALDYEWAYLGSVYEDSESPFREFQNSLNFTHTGKFVIRAVPYMGEIPIGGYKEYDFFREDDDELEWTSIQLNETSFRIRMEGQLSNNVNYVEIAQEGRVIASKKLLKDKDGKTITIFDVTGINKDASMELEYRFYRKRNAFKALVETRKDTLERHYATEPIGFTVRKVSASKFSINIQDPQELLYSPPSEIEPFSGTSWIRGIQTGKLLCRLMIHRHQNARVVSYGSYLINVTQEKKLKFIDKPPFDDDVVKIGSGYLFHFEDTQEFRDARALDNPDVSIPILYEFRLQFWTAGVEECLRTGKSYSFIKEDPIVVSNSKRLYKRSYDTWVEEHPRRRYTRIIPVAPEYAFLDHHLRYGSSPKAFVHTAEPLPVQRTRNIEKIPEEWKVLYYYNDADDEIQEFPYYCFSLRVPRSSSLEIEKLEIFIDIPDSKSQPTSLGIFHPCETIEILDFLSYYKMMLSVNSKIDLETITRPLGDVIGKDTNFGISQRKIPGKPTHSKAANTLKKSFSKNKFGDTATIGGVEQITAGSNNFTNNLSISSMSPSAAVPPSNDGIPKIGGLPSMSVNTKEKSMQAKISNTNINNSISAKVQSASVQYRVDITFRDGTTKSENFVVPTTNIPRIPKDPVGNISVSIGNKVFQESTIQVPVSAADVITSAVSKIETPGASFATKTTTESPISAGTMSVTRSRGRY